MSTPKTSTVDSAQQSPATPHEQWFIDEANAYGIALDKLTDTERQTTIADGMLNGAVEQIYTARAAFKDDATNAVTVLLAIFGAGGVLMHVAIDYGAKPLPLFAGTAGLAAFMFLLLPWFFGKSYLAKMEAGYDLYCHACINASLLFRGVKLIHSTRASSKIPRGADAFPHIPQYPHNWLEGNERNLGKAGVFLERRTASVSPSRPLGGVIFLEDKEYERLCISPFRFFWRLQRWARWQWRLTHVIWMPSDWKNATLGQHASDKDDLAAVWKHGHPNLLRLYRRTVCAAAWFGLAMSVACIVLACHRDWIT